jgi:5-methylcytosine-specific restriction endonuclease McrA
LKYEEYLRTAHWLNVKKRQLQKHQKCQVCGSQENLQVHHNTYNPFKEEENDLIVLCKSCHEKFHKELTENIEHPPRNFWPVVRLDDGRVIRRPSQLVW